MLEANMGNLLLQQDCVKFSEDQVSMQKQKTPTLELQKRN